ncbi:glycosyltransferase [Mesobacillus subterraneus]|nr:glycosyltransferase [Mesobacillus subterraneus]MCM3665242.1 glycosyltransferase [Mesobacillus subterraneus]
MNIGGTEKALLNMISELPEEKYEITILMLEKYGGLMDFIPKEVKVEFVDSYKNFKELLNDPPKTSLVKLLKQMKFIKAFIYLVLFFISFISGERSILLKYILRGHSVMENKYDAAIAYAGPMDFISFFVIHKINAKKKIQWIHFDITKVGFNKKFAKRLYKKFDRLFVVSKEAKNKLVTTLPELKDLTTEFYNVVSPYEIRSKSKNGSGFEDDFTGIRILTVGRLSSEKGQDMAIRVLAKLIKKGHGVRWYCVGEGHQRKDYERLIEKYKVKNHFILLGANTNPYPYMEQCDIYVQPSRYEGYCITVIEARCLEKPIVSTKVNGVNEQIINGRTGIIVDIDENQLYDAIELLVESPSLRKMLSENLHDVEVENTRQIDKLLTLMNK